MPVIKLKLFVPEISNVLSLFDKIQVQRSKSGPPHGDAAFITAASATPPVLTGTLSGPFNIQGQSLRISVDGGLEQAITFLSANPAAITRIVDEINHTLTGVTASSYDGALRLTGNRNGTFGTLELLGGTALNTLGFTQGQYDSGKDPHIPLMPSVSSYEYDDGSGAASYWYRTRFFNSVSGTYSSWSDWMQGSTGSILPSDKLIIGKIRLSNIDGTAWVGARVTIVNAFNPLIAANYFIAGPNAYIETDGTGYGEITLIKGAVVDVIVERTSLVRRIKVPTTGTEFDLLDPSIAIDDPFAIQVPDLPAASRRSL